jgi:hypothetical protein
MGGGYDTMAGSLDKKVAGDYQNMKRKNRKSQNIRAKMKKKKKLPTTCFIKVYA